LETGTNSIGNGRSVMVVRSWIRVRSTETLENVRMTLKRGKFYSKGLKVINWKIDGA
jgi:hypothetical protein